MRKLDCWPCGAEALAAGLLAGLIMVSPCAVGLAADWSQFRGGEAQSIVRDVQAPALQTTGRVAWRAELPGAGWSQPIVIGDRVYVTTALDGTNRRPKSMSAGAMDLSTLGMASAPKQELEWLMVCVQAESGQVLWKKTLAQGKPESGKHASNTFATETPASNGQMIVSFIGPLGSLVACDLEGQIRWRKELGQQTIQNKFGTGSSPVVVNDRVIVQQYNEDFAKLTCFNLADGAQLWQATRDNGTAWSTPIVWRQAGATEVVTAGKGVVIAYDLMNGQERWRCGGIDTSFSGSLVADETAVFIGTASPGSRAPLLAVRAGQSGDVTLAKGQSSNAGVMWSRFKSGAGMPSPVVVGENLYFFGSSATCFDKQTGQEKYRARLPGGTLVAGCPIVIEERILLVNEKGLLMTVRAGNKFVIDSQFQVGRDDELFWATPAVCSSGILLRSSEAIICVR